MDKREFERGRVADDRKDTVIDFAELVVKKPVAEENATGEVEMDLTKIVKSEEKKVLEKEVEELKEEIIKEEIKMTENKNLIKEILMDGRTNKYEIVVPYVEVAKHVQSRLNVPIAFSPISHKEFVVRYFKSTKVDNSINLLKSYYPSAGVENRGDVVKVLLQAQIPASLVEKKEHTEALLWSQPIQDVKGYTNKFPQFFGDPQFTPAEKKFSPNGDIYEVYLSTLNCVLDYLGLSRAFLKEVNTNIIIVEKQLFGDLNYSVDGLHYVILFEKE